MAALGLGSVAAIAAAVLVSRRLLRPLDRLRHAARRLAGGDLSARVPEPPDRELAALAADMNALGSALEASDERRAQLVSDLSHELRTPITSLDGFLEGLEDGVFEPDPETLAAMRFETRRLERLASDLGALSKTDEQAFDLERRAVDLGVLAAAAGRALSGAYAGSGVELDVGELPPLPIHGDSDRIGQVFTNLLRNALQHTATGGRVTVSGAAVGSDAVVRVTDTGAGIAPENLDRIFDRFVRVGSGDGSGGAGIGLTIARGIISAHGGRLTVDSPGVGRGATFAISIPYRQG
jgi:histidine kinase